MSKRLKLLAETLEDLSVLSATLQDAILRVGDIYFDKKGQSVTLLASRYCHETETPQRIKTGLGIHNILSMKSKGIERADPDAFIVLLDIAYTQGAQPPGGELRLIFAGGGELQLQTECLEARLIDIHAVRTTKSIPIHPLDE